MPSQITITDKRTRILGMTERLDGWIKLPRDLFVHEFFEDEVYSTRDAYLWLVCQAGDDAEFRFHVANLAEVFGWSEFEVTGFLQRLQHSDLIK